MATGWPCRQLASSAGARSPECAHPPACAPLGLHPGWLAAERFPPPPHSIQGDPRVVGLSVHSARHAGSGASPHPCGDLGTDALSSTGHRRSSWPPLCVNRALRPPGRAAVWGRPLGSLQAAALGLSRPGCEAEEDGGAPRAASLTLCLEPAGPLGTGRHLLEPLFPYL